MPGFLAGLLGPLAGLGTAAKAGIAAAFAAVTMSVAGGATGVLPIPGVHADGAAVAQTAAPSIPTSAASVSVSGSASTQSGGAGAQAGVAATVTVPTVPAITHAVTPAPPVPVSTSAIAVPTPTLPTLPALPACVQNLIPPKGTMPDPAKILAQLPACIQSIIAAHTPAPVLSNVPGLADLPANVSKCLSAVFAAIPNVGSGKLTSVSPTSLDPTAIMSIMAACTPTGLVPGGGSLFGGGSIPGAGSIPGLGSVTGSAPAAGSVSHK